MPYLHLDTPFSCPAETKRQLLRRLGEIYSAAMHSNINRLTVAIRELARTCSTACHGCIEILALREDNLTLEFTQHDGDEMYHTLYGGLSGDWDADKPDDLRSHTVGDFR